MRITSPLSRSATSYTTTPRDFCGWTRRRPRLARRREWQRRTRRQTNRRSNKGDAHERYWEECQLRFLPRTVGGRFVLQQGDGAVAGGGVRMSRAAVWIEYDGGRRGGDESDDQPRESSSDSGGPLVWWDGDHRRRNARPRGGAGLHLRARA